MILTLDECRKIGDSLGSCAACGRTGQYAVVRNPFGTGKVFMADPVTFATCKCGQNRWVELAPLGILRAGGGIRTNMAQARGASVA